MKRLAFTQMAFAVMYIFFMNKDRRFVQIHLVQKLSFYGHVKKKWVLTQCWISSSKCRAPSELITLDRI